MGGLAGLKRLFSPFVPKQLSIFDVFQVYGSVLPRTLIYGCVGALEGGLLKYYDLPIVTKSVWLHPYSLHVRRPPTFPSPAHAWPHERSHSRSMSDA